MFFFAGPPVSTALLLSTHPLKLGVFMFCACRLTVAWQESRQTCHKVLGMKGVAKSLGSAPGSLDLLVLDTENAARPVTYKDSFLLNPPEVSILEPNIRPVFTPLQIVVE